MSRDEKPTRQQEGVDPYYQRMARDLVDVLFDKRLLNDDLDRETIDRTEDYLAFLLNSVAKSAERTASLTARMRDAVRNAKEKAE